MKTAVARLLVAAGVLIGLTMAMAGPAAADCPAPTISISPSTGRGGDTFRIDGQNFFSSCSDAGNVGDTNVQFRFIQGSNVFDLGTATAGTPAGDFSGTLFVPTNTSAGAATVQAFGANGSPSAAFTVTTSTVASGGATPPTTRATTATTAAVTATTAAPTATTVTTVASTTTVSTAPATTETTIAAAPANSSDGLTGTGLAVTIVLLALVVIGTILASLATAGRLPLPKGRPRPRVERAAAAAAAGAAAGTAAGATAAAAADEPDRLDATAPIEPIADPFPAEAAPDPDVAGADDLSAPIEPADAEPIDAADDTNDATDGEALQWPDDDDPAHDHDGHDHDGHDHDDAAGDTPAADADPADPDAT